MELPKEWEAIVEAARGGVVVVQPHMLQTYLKDIVERCYALHTKPQRELTQAQWEEISQAGIDLSWRSDYAKKIVEAWQRKQQEPETVKFRAARSKITGSVVMCNTSEKCANWHEWEWLEPAQEIEVTLP